MARDTEHGPGEERPQEDSPSLQERLGIYGSARPETSDQSRPMPLMEALATRILEAARKEAAANNEVLGQVVAQLGRIDRHLADLAGVLADDKQHARDHLDVLAGRLSRIEQLLASADRRPDAGGGPAGPVLGPEEVAELAGLLARAVGREEHEDAGDAAVRRELAELRAVTVDGIAGLNERVKEVVRAAFSADLSELTAALERRVDTSELAEAVRTLRAELMAVVSPRLRAPEDQAWPVDVETLVRVLDDGVGEMRGAVDGVAEAMIARLDEASERAAEDRRRLEERLDALAAAQAAGPDFGTIVATLSDGLAELRAAVASSRRTLAEELDDVRMSVGELRAAVAAVPISAPSMQAIEAAAGALSALETGIGVQLERMNGMLDLTSERLEAIATSLTTFVDLYSQSLESHTRERVAAQLGDRLVQLRDAAAGLGDAVRGSQQRRRARPESDPDAPTGPTSGSEPPG